MDWFLYIAIGLAFVIGVFLALREKKKPPSDKIMILIMCTFMFPLPYIILFMLFLEKLDERWYKRRSKAR